MLDIGKNTFICFTHMKPYSDATAAIDVRAWIKNKIQEYEEEPRAGVPRGEELPVPKHKYQAAHLMLLYGSQDYPDLHKIAKEAGSTYSLLGKWRTEKKFKAITDAAALKFTQEWLKLYLWACESQRNATDPKDTASYSEMIQILLNHCQTAWGLALQHQLTQLVGERIEKKSLSFIETMVLEKLLTTLIWPKLDEKRKNIVRHQHRQLSDQLIERLKQMGLEAVKAGDTAKATSVIEEMANLLTQDSKTRLQTTTKETRA